MIIFLSIAAAAFAAFAVALGIKVYAMKKSARELVDCFSFALDNDTNAGITLSSRDRDMRKLANTLDEQILALRKSRLKYDNGNAELKKAVVDISHDLRTPLTVISGYLEMLAAEKKSKAVGEYIGIIENRVEAMKKLTEELFDYSYATSYDGEQPVTLDLKKELETTLLDFYAAFSQKKIEPDISLPETKVMRTTDRSKIQRIFANIISNAVKYSDVDFAVEMTDGGVVTFSNTARGLDPLSAARLFDRYYTVNSGGTHASGLGLSIAKELAESLGGSLGGRYESGKLYITLEL